MARQFPLRLVPVSVMMAMVNVTGSTPARPAEVYLPVPLVPRESGGSRFIPLVIAKSVVIDLPRDAKYVLVVNPQIVNAVVRSVRRASLIGVAVGQTTVLFFDAQGRQIVGVEIAVTRDGVKR